MENPTTLQETVAAEHEPISEECKVKLLQYLRESSDTAIGEEVRLPTPEEVETANNLLSIGLPRSDSAPNRQATYSDSNYNSDVVAREKVMEEYDLKDCQIRRHDIALTRGDGVLPVKVIEVAKIKIDEERNQTFEKIPNAVLFLGKIVFEGQSTRYVELNKEELEFIQEFIEKNKTK